MARGVTRRRVLETAAKFGVVIIAICLAVVGCAGDGGEAVDTGADRATAQRQPEEPTMCAASDEGIERAVTSFVASPYNVGSHNVWQPIGRVAEITRYSDAHLGEIREVRRLEGNSDFHSGQVGGQSTFRYSGFTVIVVTADGKELATQLITGGPDSDQAVDLSGLTGACAAVLTSNGNLDGRTVTPGQGPIAVAVAAAPDMPPRAVYKNSEQLLADQTSIESFATRAKAVLSASCDGSPRRLICRQPNATSAPGSN
jgi:hypothetical protein